MGRKRIYNMSAVRTRFAPSPTGLLHIGGVYIALYNYLYAKANDGQFLLRIEDTDKDRNTEEAVKVILDGLKWIGLPHDEEVVFQSTRAPRHTEVANQLLSTGKAYKCFCTAEELTASRKEMEAKKLPYKYNGKCRYRTDVPDLPYTVRMAMPQTDETVLPDLIQGEVKVKNKELDDMIILRNDGTPIYLLAVVVDDYDMKISHVLRGSDHLTNTFRQVQIYKAMGWPLPEYGHIPLIFDPSGKKLSKRNTSGFMVNLAEFKDKGYIPVAILNYLLRLGFSEGPEFITIGEMIKIFDIVKVNRSPARIDYKKLLHVNGVYMHNADDTWLLYSLLSMYREMNLTLTLENIEALIEMMPDMKIRAKTLDELATMAMFLFHKIPLLIDENAKKILTHDTKRILGALISEPDVAGTILEFDYHNVMRLMTNYANENGLKLAKVAECVRVALTGSLISPPIESMVRTLGKNESVIRIRDFMSRIDKVTELKVVEDASHS